ncbi:MAG: hypothetical protein U1F35_05690 [Steroidobacteraceae bacterium]
MTMRRYTCMRLFFCVGLLSWLSLLGTGAALASASDLTDLVTRQHSIQLQGKALRYESEAGRIAIADVGTGAAHGYMFYTAYRVPSPGKPRPVMFIWNGGPGADSSLLHFSAAGPRRAEGDRLVDNAETWLAVADLVFVDPVAAPASVRRNPSTLMSSTARGGM